MSGFTMGLPARILALGDQIDDSVIPAIRENPWKVTGLPAAYQSAATDYATATVGNILQSLRCTEVALASDTTLQTLVSVSGSGFLEFAAVGGGTTSGTVRIVLTLDGSDLIDTTGGSVATNRLLRGCGAFHFAVSTGTVVFEAWRVPFRSSLVIKAQQSATGIAAKLWTRYQLAQPYTA